MKDEEPFMKKKGNKHTNKQKQKWIGQYSNCEENYKGNL